MWEQSYSVKVSDMTAEEIWNVWTNVNEWYTWQDDIEFAQLTSEFKVGEVFKFKPKGAPTFTLEITEAVKNTMFTDLTKLPLAKMYDKHEIIRHADGLELKSTISICGPLAFLWRQIIATNIVNSLPVQTENLINKVRNVRK
ncbi:SRPBCC family protein [Vibrio mangrovi]|uniref:Polyketide cyclase / dehydrase and lipid transport n=1 Tax=Vibrio mangrovi TaxID=474394 RepID=A0A1Y6IVM5_9VIBR|nr:hypothetical protein [Vibrio mangrovi]MDW6001871.1 hypothetical protein [Vibrio mangrovi]SMS00103.1 hypothetical protein VIM7927_01344 [Vibrio mangrovi]